MTGNGIYNYILYCIIIQHLVDDSHQHITSSLDFSAVPIYYSFERYISRLFEVIQIVSMLVYKLTHLINLEAIEGLNNKNIR